MIRDAKRDQKAYRKKVLSSSSFTNRMLNCRRPLTE